MLMISSRKTIGPKWDQHNDLSHLGFAASADNGNLLTDTILDSNQTQSLYDVWVSVLLLLFIFEFTLMSFFFFFSVVLSITACQVFRFFIGSSYRWLKFSWPLTSTTTTTTTLIYSHQSHLWIRGILLHLCSTSLTHQQTTQVKSTSHHWTNHQLLPPWSPPLPLYHTSQVDLSKLDYLTLHSFNLPLPVHHQRIIIERKKCTNRN